MTFNEIAYNILNLIRSGKSSQDDMISLDQIKFNILHYRAMFIRRDYARNGKTTRHLEQDLGCINLQTVDATRCCDGFQSGCVVAKTIMPIPRTVRLNFKEAITYVGAIDGMTSIQLIDPYMAKLASYAKYTGKNRKAFFIEDYLYILNPDSIGKINVRGVFEDPRDVAGFDCEGTSCYDDNSEFPMPADMLQLITAGMVQGELQLLLGTINDTSNDRAQDKAPPAQAQRQE
tara:strand:- start:985 stop:1680 length:696 start_codon:yes stop_codon:yes gene_type:complete